MDRYFFTLVLFFSTFFLYVSNLSPSIYGTDSGDLATAVIVKGVAHPSGYPLFTLLGIVANSIPIAATPAWKIGLVSVVFSALTIVLFFYVLKVLTKNSLVSLLGAYTLAFLYPFWQYAEVVEVFALYYFFLVLLLLLTLLYIQYQRKKILFLLFFICGLSLSNNETIILFFLPLILILFSIIKKNKQFNKRTFFQGLGLFFLGLAPYIYIPFVAIRDPLMNWGNAVNVQNFLRLFFRLDYGWRVTEPFDLTDMMSSFQIYREYWMNETSSIFLLFALLGFLFLLQKKTKITVLLVSAFLLFGPFFVIYSRFPLANYLELAIMERFYIATGIFLVIFMSIGVLKGTEFLSKIIAYYTQKVTKIKNSYKYVNLILCLLFIIPVALYFNNKEKTDFHAIKVGDLFAYDMLAPLPKNSLLSFKNDTPVFNVLYVQNAYGFRKDIVIPGYYQGENRFIKQNPKLQSYIQKLIKQDAHIPEEVALLMTYATIAGKRPIFFEVKPMVENRQHTSFTFIPYGLLWKLANQADKNISVKEYAAQQDKIWKQFHVSALTEKKASIINSFVFADIKNRYARALFNIGTYIKDYYKDSALSKGYFEKAIQLDATIIENPKIGT